MITQELLESCEAALDARYETLRLYEQDDPDTVLAEQGAHVRAIAGGNVDASLMAKLPNLKMISNFGVGYDSIDIAEAKKRGISVTNTPDVLNDAMAELTIGLMVSLARRIPQADQYVRQGAWETADFPLQSELTGKTVGIAGLGRIGREIASRCQAMKMRVIYFGRNKQVGTPYIHYDNLVEMARDADWLVVMTPGGEATNNLVNRKVLQALGPSGYLVSMARGSVVEQSALIDLLQGKKLAGAALDVFENEPQVPEELRALDNVVLSPHQGSATRQTRFAMGALVVANLEAFFAGKPLLSPVV